MPPVTTDAKNALLAILAGKPGIIAVGFGPHANTNAPVPAICLVVFYETDPGTLPATVEGFPVEKIAYVKQDENDNCDFGADEAKYKGGRRCRNRDSRDFEFVATPLEGGIHIHGSRGRIGHNGTLGFFARIKDGTQERMVAVTNRHVVDQVDETDAAGKRTGRVKEVRGQRMGQPLEVDAGSSCDEVLGKVVTGYFNAELDLAFVALEPNYQLFARVHDGTRPWPLEPPPRRNEQKLVNTENAAAPGLIMGVAHIGTAALSTARIVGRRIRVQKRGVRTGVTFGFADYVEMTHFGVEHDGITRLPTQEFWVVPEQPTPLPGQPPPPFRRFSCGNDSGSLILNEASQAVGLLWGGVGTYTFGITIAELQKVNDLTVITSQQRDEVFTVPEGNGLTALVPEDRRSRQALLHSVRRLDGTRQGGRMIELLSRDRREVSWLIERDEALAGELARVGGRELLRAVYRLMTEDEFRFPETVGQLPVDGCVAQVSDVLRKHGSHRLRRDLEELAPALAQLAGKNIDELAREWR